MSFPSEGTEIAPASLDTSPTDEQHRVLVCLEQPAQLRNAIARRLPGVRVDAQRPTDKLWPDDTTALLAWDLPEGALMRLPRLRWLQVAGAGVEHFLHRDDLANSVVLTRSLGRFGIQIAEYTVGYVLALLLDIEGYRADQVKGRWNRRPRPLLSDLTVGMIGLGEIGSTVAKMMRAVGARVVGVRRSGGNVPGVETVLDCDHWRELLPQCQVLVLATPSTAQTRNMIDAEALDALPTGAILVNAGRGDLIDEAALDAALSSGHLRGAVLDVFREEPLPSSSPLWREPRAWVTPHIAGPTEIEPAADEFADNYRRFERGEPLRYTVERHRGY